MAGRKLKVFQAQFGFYDTVVAAPSGPRCWANAPRAVLWQSGQLYDARIERLA
jgi:hypothetical protein